MGKRRIFAEGILVSFIAIFMIIFSVRIVRAEESIPEITIWVDQDSEYVIRMALVNYEWLGRGYGGENENFPVLSYNLVDKSYLTPEQFGQELEQELQAGRGPDLIYIDEASGISPQYLMESGYLLELKDITKNTLREGNWEYLPGVLESGQMQGKQYVLPVYIQCPVVFGVEEVMEQAGLDTEEGYQSLRELLEALIEAAEISGKQIFEDTTAVDWMEEYCLPQEGSGADEEEIRYLRDLLARIREYCGEEKHYFAPYEALSSGKSLLSGCTLEWKQKMAQNLGMMEQDQSIAFLSIPSWDGDVRAVIRQSVAVNANSLYPSETLALMRIFQESYVNSGIYSGRYFPAVAASIYWQDSLSASLLSQIVPYVKKGRYISKTDRLSRQFVKNSQEAVTDAVFENVPAAHTGGAEEQEELTEKKVLTVGFDDRGMGEEHPIYRWLKNTAENNSNEDFHIQIIPFPLLQDMIQMEQIQAGVDVLLKLNYFLDQDYPDQQYNERFTDLTPLLEHPEELHVVNADGEIKGIVFGKFEENGSSREYLFTVFKSSDLKKEAVDFCLAALKDENYDAAIEEAGIMPVD